MFGIKVSWIRTRVGSAAKLLSGALVGTLLAGSALAGSLPVTGSFLTNNSGTAPDVKGTSLSVQYTVTSGIGHLQVVGTSKTYYPNGVNSSGTAISNGTGLFDLDVY